jgi:hypothetical protein
MSATPETDLHKSGETALSDAVCVCGFHHKIQDTHTMKCEVHTRRLSETAGAIQFSQPVEHEVGGLRRISPLFRASLFSDFQLNCYLFEEDGRNKLFQNARSRSGKWVGGPKKIQRKKVNR